MAVKSRHGTYRPEGNVVGQPESGSWRAAALLTAVCCAPASVLAGADNWPYIQQIFIGVHDHATPLTSSGRERGIDISAEAKFRAPRNRFWERIGSPRPHLGTTINLNGQTDQAYAGVTYRFDPFHKQFLDISGGAAVHNGKLETDDPKRRSLGKRVLFRAAIEYGYQITPEHGLSVVYDHISNGFNSGSNQGIDTVGMRYSYDMTHYVHGEAQVSKPVAQPVSDNTPVYGPVGQDRPTAYIRNAPIYLDERAVETTPSQRSGGPYTIY